MTGKTMIVVGAACGFLSVAMGAFAAHGLKRMVGPDEVAWVQTGAQYQMYHSLGLVLIGILSLQTASSKSLLSLAAVALIVGIVIFSGSLYVMALTGERKLGMITPIGGVAFLLGWALLAVAALRKT